MDTTLSVVVPPDRLERWLANFAERHGSTDFTVVDGALCGTAADGSTFSAELPFDRHYDGPAEAEHFLLAAEPPADWGVLLVRKRGYSVGRLCGGSVSASKTGSRYVQGRTAAGGQSQQRFARRRENQAKSAYAVAADHAARLIGDAPVLVVGGDREALRAVLADPRLTAASARVVGPPLAVPDPRRAVLDEAVRAACSVRMSVVNA